MSLTQVCYLFNRRLSSWNHGTKGLLGGGRLKASRLTPPATSEASGFVCAATSSQSSRPAGLKHLGLSFILEAPSPPPHKQLIPRYPGQNYGLFDGWPETK